MKVVEVINPGHSAKLELAERPIPSINDNEVLVSVKAIGVNRADIFQKQGSYNPPAGVSDILGLEIAGEIEKLGAKVQSFKLKDKVMAVVKGGAYAEYAAVPADHLISIPEDLDFIKAASLPEAIFTAYLSLFEFGELKQNEEVLIHAGASGIGTIAIQMVKAKGARVYSTSRKEEKLELIKKLGATPINSEKEDFAVQIKNLTNGKGVNLIIDIAGGNFFQKNLSALAVHGRLVQLAFLEGAKMNVDLAPILMKNLAIKSFRLRSLSNQKISEVTEKVKEDIIPLIESQKIIPVIDSVFDIYEVQKAHDKMEANKNLGKIILKF